MWTELSIKVHLEMMNADFFPGLTHRSHDLDFCLWCGTQLLVEFVRLQLLRALTSLTGDASSPDAAPVPRKKTFKGQLLKGAEIL